MDQDERSRWWHIGKQVLVAAVALIALIILIRIGYAYNWSGFGESNVEDKEVRPYKTLWDWLGS